MRSLITGGAGFIGSHLVDTLIRRGDTVYVLDDLSSGRLENISPAARDSGRLHLLISRVEDFATLSELVESVDRIFHLAAAVGVRMVVEEPVRSLETNLRATECILLAASLKQTPVFLASTSEVYGRSTASSFSETDDLVIGTPTIGRWGYACSKAYDEFLAMAYAREYQIPLLIGRLFNTVGPRQLGRYGMVLPRFVRQALQCEAITVYGDGHQTRCFCHVADTIQMIISLMELPFRACSVFNIGNDEAISILDLALLVKKCTASGSEIKLVPYEEAYGAGFEDIRHRKPDLSRIRNAIPLPVPRGLDTVIRSVANHECPSISSVEAKHRSVRVP